MNILRNLNQIIVVDREAYWRQLASQALVGHGMSVIPLNGYKLADYAALFQTQAPGLVVLGCAQIKAEEVALIEYIQSWQHPLLVLCLSLPWATMRELFKLGVDDAAEKPYDPAQIVEVVQEALRTVAKRESQFIA